MKCRHGFTYISDEHGRLAQKTEGEWFCFALREAERRGMNFKFDVNYSADEVRIGFYSKGKANGNPNVQPVAGDP